MLRSNTNPPIATMKRRSKEVIATAAANVTGVILKPMGSLREWRRSLLQTEIQLNKSYLPLGRVCSNPSRRCDLGGDTDDRNPHDDRRGVVACHDYRDGLG